MGRLTNLQYQEYCKNQKDDQLELFEFHDLMYLSNKNYENFRNILLNLFNFSFNKDREINLLLARDFDQVLLNKILNISRENLDSDLFQSLIIPAVIKSNAADA